MTFTVFIPLYIYPLWFLETNDWKTLSNLMARHPSVEFVLFVNPDSGPPETENTDFTAGFALLKSQGNASHIKILGYVPTGFGAIPLATVQRDVDLYYQFWPNDINGILIDEMDNITGHETYYTNITNYIRSKKSDQLVVANPGTSTISGYVNTVDVLQVSESVDYPSIATVNTATFNGAFNRGKFTVGVHGATVYNAPLIEQITQRAQYFFVTTDVLPNPYDTLSVFLENLASQTDKKLLSSRSINAISRNNHNITRLNDNMNLF